MKKYTTPEPNRVPNSHETSLKPTEKPKKPSMTSTVQALEQAHLLTSVDPFELRLSAFHFGFEVSLQLAVDPGLRRTAGATWQSP